MVFSSSLEKRFQMKSLSKPLHCLLLPLLSNFWCLTFELWLVWPSNSAPCASKVQLLLGILAISASVEATKRGLAALMTAEEITSEHQPQWNRSTWRRSLRSLHRDIKCLMLLTGRNHQRIFWTCMDQSNSFRKHNKIYLALQFVVWWSSKWNVT